MDNIKIKNLFFNYSSKNENENKNDINSDVDKKYIKKENTDERAKNKENIDKIDNNKKDKIKSTLILENINIDIFKGDFVAIIGHNGSGKSTLAKHINALLLPDKGDLLIDGLNTKDEFNTWEIRQKVGIVFQNPDNQIIATIVEEELAFGPENIGLDPLEIENRINYALKVINMEEYKKFVPSLLSGGQKQKIAIAGILAMKPKYIVLDEVTSMLDPMSRKEIIKTITKLNKEEGITIILITHFMEEVTNANRVIVMENGKVVLDDEPRKIFSKREKLKKLNLELPQITELSYNLNKLGLDIPANILSIDEMVDALCRLK